MTAEGFDEGLVLLQRKTDFTDGKPLVGAGNLWRRRNEV